MSGSRPRMRDRSAAHIAEWQDLELIFCQLLQHGNMRERREGVAHASLKPAEAFMRACCRPTEAACFRVRKGANNRQLIVAGVKGFYDTHTQLTSILYRHAKGRVCYIITYTIIHTQTLIGLFFVHRIAHTHGWLTRW